MTSIFALLAFIFGGASAYFALLSRRSEQARKTAEQDNITLRMECEKVKIETTSRIESLNSVLADLKFTNERLSLKLDESSRQTGAVKEENSALTARIEMLQREKEENEKSRAQQEEIFENRFKNLANDILRQNTTDLKTQNEEKLREILQPLHSNIEEFRKTVSETYNNEARERFSLSERIKDLVSLNQAISRQAHELSEALRGDSKVQGDWGEMVLESILEKSGLQKGVEYFIQASTDETGNTLRNEDGTLLRPDVVVRYPDKRYVVIDSKVSLTAFVDYANASDEESRQMASLRHVRSVKKHIDELTKKRYQDYVGDSKLDFVMMFIPTEPAYIAAMRLEPTLWQEAYDKNVLIVSPTHLVSGLKLIAQLWSRDRHTRNAITIAEEAGKMYDKFADFTKDMEKIEKALGSTRKAFDDAMTKLSCGTGNLVTRAQNLQKLGVKANKQIAASLDRNRLSDED